MTPPFEAKAFANLLLEWCERDRIPVTPMKLQKLIYFCHADYLKQFSIDLIKQNFEAWEYGPVIPSIYSEFKREKDQPIKRMAEIFDPISAKRYVARCVLSPSEEESVGDLYSFYKNLSAGQLSDLSHEHGGPWRQARSLFANGLNMDRRISSDMIRRYHRLIHN